MTSQLESEKAALLERKRREQDDARRRQEDLERILAENRRKVRGRPRGVTFNHDDTRDLNRGDQAPRHKSTHPRHGFFHVQLES